MISNLTDYVSSYGLTKVKISGFVTIYESALKALTGKPTPLVKDHWKENNSYFYPGIERHG